MNMKKKLLIIAVMISATVANAQIKKVWTGWIEQLGSGVQVLECNSMSLIGNYIMTGRESGDTYYYDIMDASSLSIAKTFTEDSQNNLFNIKEREYGPFYMSKGIFSTDDKWACIVFSGEFESEEGYRFYSDLEIRNEDGTTLATIPWNTEARWGVKLMKTRDSYKLLVRSNDGTTYDIYSLPGNDLTQDLVATPLPKNMTARKIVQNGQVLVETENNTYNIQGHKLR